MKLGKMAFFAVVGLTGCGADDSGPETPAAVAPQGEGGSGAGGEGGSGVGAEGGSAGTAEGGSAGTGAEGGSGAGGGSGGSGGSAGSAGGTSGAGGTGLPPEPDVATAVANIDVNLERLRALHVVEVKSLIILRPGETGNCYGACPEDKSRAAVRLQKLVELAETAVKNDYLPASCIDRVDANLAALSGLQIVELGAFLRIAPANNPLCYNTPCPSDIEAAAVENEARAADLESIALSSKLL